MEDFFELIDLVSGNLAGDYDSVDDALAALHVIAVLHGKSTIEHFSLMRIDDFDQTLVAMEEDLVSLVESFGRRTDGAKIDSRVS
jgi:hypothetical protein